MSSILPVVPADLDALIAISEQTFYETFFHLTKQEPSKLFDSLSGENLTY
jgi:hypothetical protein